MEGGFEAGDEIERCGGKIEGGGIHPEEVAVGRVHPAAVELDGRQIDPNDPGFRPAALDPRGRGPEPAADVEHRGDRFGRPGDQPIDERRRRLLWRAGRIAPQADVVVVGVAVPTAHRRREDDGVVRKNL